MATGPCRRSEQAEKEEKKEFKRLLLMIKKASQNFTFKVREEGVVLGHLLHHRLEDGSVDVVGVDALDCGVKDQLLLQLVGAEEAADADGPRQL